jgi:hypothetical protein
MRSYALLALCLLSVPAVAAEVPDAKITPGATRPVTLQELCSTSTRDYRETMDPDAKREAYQRYGLAHQCEGYCSGPEGCEVDHLVPLELGGANDPRNLWPEPFAGAWGAHSKDKLENTLHNMVCEGHLPLEQAQHEIATDWEAAYRRYLGEPKEPRPFHGRARCE